MWELGNKIHHNNNPSLNTIRAPVIVFCNKTVNFAKKNLRTAIDIKQYNQGGEGRISEAENLRSSSQIQSIFNLLGRTGKIIIFIIRVGIWRCN